MQHDEHYGLSVFDVDESLFLPVISMILEV